MSNGHGHGARLLREIHRMVGDSTEAAIVDNDAWAQVLARAGLSADEASRALAILWHAGTIQFDKKSGEVRLTREGIEHAARIV